MTIPDSTQREVDRLNLLLADPVAGVGRSPAGGPRYRWALSTDIWYPAADGYEEYMSPAGLILPRQRYVKRLLATFDETRWVLAKWCHPHCTESVWYQQYGSNIEYPREGVWIIEFPLDPGAVPNERITVAVIGEIRADAKKTLFDFSEEKRIADERKERAEDSENYAQLKDALPELPLIPGHKGEWGVSFGGTGDSRLFGGSNDRPEGTETVQ